MKYGIELEFFVTDRMGTLIPAYKFTNNTDGNPVIGELRTGIHDNILDCVFELKKLIHLETSKLENKNCLIDFSTVKKVNDDFLRDLRKSSEAVNKKEITVLHELSIYPNGTVGKMLPKDTLKASLQINFSENKNFTFTEYEKVTVEDKYKYEHKTSKKSYASLFDYVTVIHKLDNAFKKEIVDSKRVKGVYAIKEGNLGDRLEYRSLPNNVDLDKLIKVLS